MIKQISNADVLVKVSGGQTTEQSRDQQRTARRAFSDQLFADFFARAAERRAAFEARQAANPSSGGGFAPSAAIGLP